MEGSVNSKKPLIFGCPCRSQTIRCLLDYLYVQWLNVCGMWLSNTLDCSCWVRLFGCRSSVRTTTSSPIFPHSSCSTSSSSSASSLMAANFAGVRKSAGREVSKSATFICGTPLTPPELLLNLTYLRGSPRRRRNTRHQHMRCKWSTPKTVFERSSHLHLAYPAFD